MTFHSRTRSQARHGRRSGRVFRPGVHSVESRLLLSTFTVTSASDDFSGGTLREAIIESNASPDPGTNTIEFDIPGAGPHVIKPYAPLPKITKSVVIDGYTQPGSSPNTAAQGDNAVLSIQIDGSGISDISKRLGLLISADDSTVRGLSIVNFDGYGMVLDGTNNHVEGNFIGVLPNGLTSAPNGLGLGILGGGAVVGGTAPAARNLISGNAAGLALGNLDIGGSAGAVVQNNLIGTDATGNGDLGNEFVGIALVGSNNVIGGTGAGQANTIAYNGQVGAALNLGAGLVVAGLKQTADAPPALLSRGNLISGNAIFANQKVGIAQLDIPLSSVTQLGDLSSGNAITTLTKALASVETHANTVASPVLTSAVNSNGVTTVLGTVTGSPGVNYRLQFFSNGGRVFLGQSVVTINAAGTGSIDFTPATSVAVGQDILATAIAPDNSTSPFSSPILVTNPVTPVTPPSLAAIPDQTVSVGDTIQFTAFGSDPDPSHKLVYSTNVGAIDASTGKFVYTAPATPTSVRATITVTDTSTSPSQSASQSFTINVIPRPPQVTGTNVAVSKRFVSRIVVHFGEAVTGADNPANYHLALVTTKRVRGRIKTVSKPVRIKAVTYDPSTFTSAVLPAGKVSPKKVNQLTISGAGIRDAFGRPLDGDQNGTPGGDVVIKIGKS